MIYLVVKNSFGTLSIRNFLDSVHRHTIEEFANVNDLIILDHFSSYEKAYKFMQSYKDVMSIMEL